MRFNSFFSALGGALLTVLAALHGMAQDANTIPTTIFIEFHLHVPEARLTFDDPDAADKAISKEFAAMLATEFPWNFQSGDSSVFPRLDVWLDQQGQEWDVHLTLTHKAGSPPKPLDPIVLWKPGDLAARGGLPQPSDWFNILATCLNNALFVPKRLAVVNVLKVVPLGMSTVGKEVVMIQNPPTSTMMARSVLPLDWARYQFLANSEFSVQYTRQNGGDAVWSRAKGLGVKFDYKPGNRQFDGVLIRHLKWMSAGAEEDISGHLSDFPQLVPQAFYIDQLEESDNPLLLQAP